MTTTSRAGGRVAQRLFGLGELGLWLFVILIFASSLASGDWVFVGIILGPLVAFCVAALGMRAVAVLWLVGSPTIFVLANNVLQVIPFVTVERALFAGLLGLVVLSYAFRRLEPVEQAAVEKPMALFLFLALFSLLGALTFVSVEQWKSDTAFYIQGYFMPLLAFVLLRRLPWRERDATLLVYLFMFVGFFLGVIGLAQLFFGFEKLTPTWTEVINEGRATGVFSNATEFGSSCAVAMLLCIFVFYDRKDPMVRALAVMAAASAAVGLAISQTRAPWLATLLCLGWIFLCDPRTRFAFVMGAALGGVVLAAVLPAFMESDIFRGRVLEMDPIYNRLALFATALHMIARYPLTGVGFGNDTFPNAKDDYLQSFGPVSAQYAADVGPPHNEFVHIAVLGGIPLLVCFIAIWIILWRSLGRIRRLAGISATTRGLALYSQVIILQFLVISLFVDSGKLIFLNAFMFAFAGIVHAVASRQASSSNR